MIGDLLKGAAIPRSIGAQVAASATDDETGHTVTKDATIRDPSLRIYPGAELDLQIKVLLDLPGGERVYILPDQGPNNDGKAHLDGDDDVYAWPGAEWPVPKDTEIIVQADNNDGTNAYDYRFNFTEDRHGGLERAVGSLKRLLGVV